VVFYNNKSLRQYETDAAQTALRLAGEWSGLADPAGVVGYRQRLREGVEAHLRVSEEEVLRIVRQVIGTCRYLSLLIVTDRGAARRSRARLSRKLRLSPGALAGSRLLQRLQQRLLQWLQQRLLHRLLQLRRRQQVKSRVTLVYGDALTGSST
jgi:hypothetical protein